MTATPVETARRCVVCHAVYVGTERFCPIDGGAIVVGQPASDADDPHLGKTIDGRYLVRRLIGRGGMGSVYEADHIGLDKRVAIKFLIGDATDRDALARFRREARAASKIVHENVVQIFDVGAEDGVAFIVMEYLEGRDLRQELAGGALPPARAVAIARQMLRGLDAIHEGGIVHRDIKPANVLLTARGEDEDVVKIMDFGISKEIDGVAHTLTGTGKVIGTPQYMSPEQLSGAQVDARSDLYAVGLTLHEMLGGTPTFEGASSSVLAAMHLSQPPPSLDAVRPGLPAHVVGAVERALAKAPSERFVDARAFADALGSEGPLPSASRGSARASAREAATVPASRSRPAAPAPRADEPAATARTRTRDGARWVALTAIVIVGGIAIAFAIRQRGREPSPPRGAIAADAPRAPSTPSAEQHLAYARAAENEGKIELAIAEYGAAYAVAPGADSLFRIAGLYERLGNRAEAAQYLSRYLEAAPTATDREIVTTRIAALTAAAVDAGVDAPPITARVSNRKPPPEAERSPLAYCMCIPVDGHDGTAQLCKVKLAAKCRCERSDGVNLCPVPFEACSGSGCGESSAWDGKYCPHPGYTDYVIPGTHRGACTGYANPAETAPDDGRFACGQCIGASAHPFRGRAGDPCNGFHSSDGRPVAGRLDSCVATHPD